MAYHVGLIMSASYVLLCTVTFSGPKQAPGNLLIDALQLCCLSVCL